MKVDTIELTNYKKIRSLILNIDGDNLAVTGTTGQGKTTVISALWELIEMVGEPITNGEAKGKIKITLSDGQKKVYAERKFTQKTKTINIIDSEGKKVSVAEFKNWFSSLADNPQDLLNLSDAKLMEKLAASVQFPAGFDLKQVEYGLACKIADREELATTISALEKNLGVKPEKVVAVDTVALMQELQTVQDLDKKYTETEENVDKAIARIGAIDAEILTLQAEKKKLVDWKPGTQQWLKETIVDVAAVQNKINNIAADNVKAATYTTWINKEADLNAKKTNRATVIEHIKTIKKQLKDGLEDAKWPLQGLSIVEGVVHYKNVPFSQAGDSEKMLICGILAAEQIKDSTLKVVRMDGIESMSIPDFEFLKNFFNAKGIQVLSTRVARGSAEPGELIIQDGGIL